MTDRKKHTRWGNGRQLLPSVMTARKDSPLLFRRGIAAVTLVLVLLLTSCGASGSSSGTREAQAFTRSQIMLIVANERNRYRDIYTDQIWAVAADDEGTTFEEYLIEEIHQFIIQIQLLNDLAGEQGVTLTSQEREMVRELAEEYYESLSDEDLAYTGASGDDVSAMYEAYCLANKLVDVLTADVDLEISDSEARIMTVQELTFPDAAAAQETYLQLTAEGADFAKTAAALTGQEVTETSVGRGERSQEYEAIVFALEDGQICEPFFDQEVWYVVRCVRDYEPEKTQERKERLSLQRKNQAFRRIYDAFAAEHSALDDEEIWKGISLTTGEGSQTKNFFELYQDTFDSFGG